MSGQSKERLRERCRQWYRGERDWRDWYLRLRIYACGRGRVHARGHHVHVHMLMWTGCMCDWRGQHLRGTRKVPWGVG